MRRLATIFGSTIGSRLAIAAVNYALFWSLTRLLDAERVGGFSVVMGVFFMVQLLPLMGLSIPIIRRVATRTDDLASEVTNAFGFAAPVGLVIALAVGVGGHLAHGGTLAAPMWLIAAAVLPTSWIIVAETCLVGLERLVVVARVNTVESALRTVFALVAVHFGGGLAGVFGVFLALRIGTALFYLRHAGLPAPDAASWRRAAQRRNLAEVPVYCGIALCAAVTTRLDIFVVSSQRGLAEAATYSAAARLYEAALMVPTVLSLMLMPVLARQFVASQERFRTVLRQVLRGVLVGGLAAALVAAALARPVVDLLYRPELADAAPVLRWLLLAAALTLTDALLSSAMLAAKAQKHDLRALLAGLAVLAVVLFAGVRDFGAQGAAAAVAASLVVRIVVRLHWATRHFGMPPMWGDLARTLVCAGLSFAVLLHLLPRGVLASMAIALASYVGAHVASGGLGPRPLHRLRALRAGVLALGQRPPQRTPP